MKYLRIKAEQEFEQRNCYARSFQTKRYIRYTTQKVMESNIFLKYYGYVELDNEVDLSKFRFLESEFARLNTFLPVPVAKDHSFRIKKLGKHRAEGIYFPHYKATILDIDHPQSYVHELAHQIDYTFTQDNTLLSENLDFRVVTDRYKYLVNQNIEALENDSLFKKKWFGRTKYNCDYFYQNTEIFARCFEIYLAQRNVTNAFFVSNLGNDPVYPQTPDFTVLINNYFNKLLQRLYHEQSLSKN